MVKMCYPEPISIAFKEIISRIRDRLSPDYIFLAGSFGKGSWLFSEDGLLLSDVEIVFVCRQKWDSGIKKQLVKELNELFSYKIELKGFILDKVKKRILTNYSFKNPGYLSLNFFDVFSYPRMIYQKNELGLNIDLDPGKIPAWEAWRLIMNRLGEYMFNADDSAATNTEYARLKMIESIGDAYCINMGVYDKRIERRIELLTEAFLEKDQELPVSCKSSWKYIQTAYRSRHDHALGSFFRTVSTQDMNALIFDWKEYFEDQLSIKESIDNANKSEFYLDYLNKTELQKKYIDVSDGLNIPLSNAFKFINKRNDLAKPFRRKIFGSSWRHMILLSISSYFFELYTGKDHFEMTRMNLSELLEKKYVDNLDSDGLRETIVRYWKIVR